MSTSLHVVLFGSTGMLGNTVKQYLKSIKKYDLICITRKHLDILNHTQETLQNEIDCLFKSFPTKCVVINAIGLIPHSGNCNDDDYLKINSEFPKVLDKLCDTFNFKFIHITTDCVFNGLGNGNYNEYSKKDETNIYGRSKALGENLKNATIIRTSIIGEQNQPQQNKRSESDDSIKRSDSDDSIKRSHFSLLQWVRSNSGGSIKGFTNHYWNGVTCLRLAQILDKIISNNLYWKGVSHIFSNTVSKYELIKYINVIYNLNIKIDPVKSESNIDKSLSSSHITNNIINQYLGEINIYQQIKEQMYFFKEINSN